MDHFIAGSVAGIIDYYLLILAEILSINEWY
jgi:hypothetical protein